MRGLRGRIRLFRISRRMKIVRRLVGCGTFWRLARRFKPVLTLGGTVWVSRHDDVLDVLKRDRDFRVPYLPNLEGLRSPFLLGLPDGDDYRRQLRVLRNALHHQELPNLEELSIVAAKRALDKADGTIDVVRDLTERVLMDSVGTYLGTGPTTPAQLEQSRAIFYEVFINPLRNPMVIEQAGVAGAALRAHIAELVADRCAAARSNQAGSVDVLGLLVGAIDRDEMTSDEVINSLLGLFVGWTGPVSRSMGYSMEALLKQPEGIRLGRDAARSGDPDTMGKVMLEALRFRPSAPALERICTRDTHIAGHRLTRGTKVMVLVNSAMMDETRVTTPRRFNPSRAEIKLHFGHQQHYCIGDRISMVQMRAISSVLLAREGVRAISKLRFEGPYPSQLVVEFGRAPA